MESTLDRDIANVTIMTVDVRWRVKDAGIILLRTPRNPKSYKDYCQLYKNWQQLEETLHNMIASREPTPIGNECLQTAPGTSSAVITDTENRAESISNKCDCYGCQKSMNLLKE